MYVHKNNIIVIPPRLLCVWWYVHCLVSHTFLRNNGGKAMDFCSQFFSHDSIWDAVKGKSIKTVVRLQFRFRHEEGKIYGGKVRKVLQCCKQHLN